MNKKRQKTHRKHQAQSHGRGRKSKPSSTSSNWDVSVRVATDGDMDIRSIDNSSSLGRGEFSPGEIGQIAPLDQEGEGNRQNAEAEELEQIEPGEDVKER